MERFGENYEIMITSVLLMKASFKYFELKYMQVKQYTILTDQ